MKRLGREASGRELRILFIDDAVTFGGAILSLADLVPDLRDRGVAPFVVSGQSQSDLDRLFPDTFSRHWSIHVPWVAHAPLRSDPASHRTTTPVPVRRKASTALWFLRNDFPNTLRVIAFCLRHRIDLVHLNTGVSFLPGMMAASVLGIPLVIHYRGIRGKVRLASGLQRRLIPSCDAFIAISESVRTSLVEGGFPERKVRTIYNGIDLRKYRTGGSRKETREALGLAESTLVVGNFGRITKIKGLREFVTAWASVVRSVPEAHALIVGDESDGDPEYFGDLVRQVEGLGLGGKITFTGFRSDVPDLMHACDLVAHSAVHPEGFGRVIVEAWAAGRPVVASNLGSPRDLVRDGVDGFLVDPSDAGALSSRIVTLLKDPDLRRTMGDAGQSRGAEFSTERCADQIVSLYREVLDRQRSR